MSEIDYKEVVTSKMIKLGAEEARVTRLFEGVSLRKSGPRVEVSCDGWQTFNELNGHLRPFLDQIFGPRGYVVTMPPPGPRA